MALMLEGLHNEPSYKAPFFTVYFTTAWLALIYPLRLVIALIRRPKQFSLRKACQLDACAAVTHLCHSESKLRLLLVLLKALGFCALWTTAAYAYVRAFSFGRAHEITAKFVLHSNFLYILSWLLLEKRFVWFRVSDGRLLRWSFCVLGAQLDPDVGQGG